MCLIENMHLRWGVIKATPNRKCYMWYVKMCMLDSNCPVFEHRDHAFNDHLLEMVSINVEYEDPVLLKRARFATIMYSRRYELCG